ncbi:MAG: valine--tRNA ligase [Oligoflexales bacterium]
MSQFETTYDHKKYEKKWWDHWMTGGWFHAKAESQKPAYTILIPPPNVTSRLHMGHGLNNTIQDILVRWKRMQGYNCCWLPGTDHAGIATQMMVEKSLESEGSSRLELGRDKFLQKCVEWKDENGGIIIEQQKRLGSSCDWDREAYTMSPELSNAVRRIFVDLYSKGLIYRGERLVNWDPVLKTAISDDEVVSEEVTGNLWYYRYPLEDDPEQGVVIATTRPETMFGDTAVAVNPEDERFKHLIGKRVVVPFVERSIPVIADDYVKSEYGSGCVKITPAHDPNDFEMGKRHDLPFINVMNLDGSMNDVCPEPFHGLDRFEARKLLIKKLKELKLLEKTESNRHAVPFSDRSKVPIEPRLSKQWYVKMAELAVPAIEAAKSKQLKFYPPSWEKTYLHWLENIQDWCISRQLWWGHQIPIWYCADCGEVSTGLEDPSECSNCQSSALKQDEDVLDTWFSSWLWPLSPFGWPEETKDLKAFFPSNVLITAPEIIYLWVARMVMMSYFTKGTLPFKDVYFNATICDKQGRKFSKTLGNGIDPLKVIDQYGADSVRYTCVSLAPLGGRVKMAETDFEAGNKFINKIWNAYRFLMGKLDGKDAILAIDDSSLDLPSKWLLQELHMTAQVMDEFLGRYQINEAVEALFHLIWRSYCDWGLETAKDVLDGKPSKDKDQVLSTLVFVFEGIMRLAAPIIPFICEEIWQNLPEHPSWQKPESLMIAEYPKADSLPTFVEDGQRWKQVQEVISHVRSVRTQAKVPPKDKLTAYVCCDQKFVDLLQKSEKWVSRLAGINSLVVGDKLEKPKKCLVATGKGWTLYVPVGKYLDFENEKIRLEGEVKRVERIVKGLEGKLNNPNFVKKAPKEVVEQSSAQLENMQGQLKSLRENLSSISN